MCAFRRLEFVLRPPLIDDCGRLVAFLPAERIAASVRCHCWIFGFRPSGRPAAQHPLPVIFFVSLSAQSALSGRGSNLGHFRFLSLDRDKSTAQRRSRYLVTGIFFILSIVFHEPLVSVQTIPPPPNWVGIDFRRFRDSFVAWVRPCGAASLGAVLGPTSKCLRVSFDYLYQTPYPSLRELPVLYIYIYINTHTHTHTFCSLGFSFFINATLSLAATGALA